MSAKHEALGLLWEDESKAASGEKRQAPERVWERPDYLPNLAEALAFNVPLMTWDEIEQARLRGDELLFDIEEYPNYFLIVFCSFTTGKSFYFEMTEETPLDINAIQWVIMNFRLVSFNGIKFDMPILALALAGHNCAEINHAASMLIYMEMPPWQVLKSYKVEPLDVDHIDLIEVAPLSGSLKAYSGRLHAPKLQDLPFPPDTILSPEQIAIIRFYCINDLTGTGFIRKGLKDQIALRVEMSAKYGVDVRSKSDAQIAEAVIAHEMQRITGLRPQRPEVEEGTAYSYRPPAFLRFSTPGMIAAFETVKGARFIVEGEGKIKSEQMADLTVRIGKTDYKMGVGGLHSMEKCAGHRSDATFKIVDRDVTSYYPSIIINSELYPPHLGRYFLQVYKSIVERRIAAKEAKRKPEAESLKIVINGSFGKFGSKWSILYAPDLLIQTTLTGQLSLLMLIERLEMAGIQIISGNTDGIVMKFPRVIEDTANLVIAQWEKDTGFKTEDTEYIGLFSRDINNYLAIKPDGKTKTKGAYANPWADPDLAIFRFHKNPVNTICVEAATAYLVNGTPVEDTIRGCTDIRKFVTVRTVKGGGVKDGVYLGKVVRWYYATGIGGEIVYASNGNKVPLSDGARPLMQLPAEFPGDVDFARYEADTLEILRESGAIALL
jgi:hypothetical protein